MSLVRLVIDIFLSHGPKVVRFRGVLSCIHSLRYILIDDIIACTRVRGALVTAKVH